MILVDFCAAFVTESITYFDEFLADYRRRRDVLVDGLARIGFKVRPPAGTYFVLADHTQDPVIDDVFALVDAMDQIAIGDFESSGRTTAAYNMACGYALMKQREPALRYLRRSLESGYKTFRHIQFDPDLEFLHDDPRFRRLIGQLRLAEETQIQFRKYGWPQEIP